MKINKKVWILPLIVICLGLVFALSIMPTTNKNTIVNEGISWGSEVCIYKNDELLGCTHNVLYDTGAELIENLLGDDGSGGPAKNISLCNVTAGCGTPVADASETWNEFSSCGLASAQGTYSSNAPSGNWTISKTFTSTCDCVETNVTRIGTNAGINLAGNAFTYTAKLCSSDTLAVNWTIYVT